MSRRRSLCSWPCSPWGEEHPPGPHPSRFPPAPAWLLVDTFGIAGIGTVEEDLARFFGA